MSSAPTSTIPWIELAADISGVCSVAGTLPMTSMPTSSASTKMVRSVTRAVDIRVSLGLELQQLGHGWMHDLAVVCHDDPGLDLVAEVDFQRAFGGHVQQQRRDVPRIGAGGSGRHGRWQVLCPDDRDAVLGHHGFPGHRAGDVAAE